MDEASGNYFGKILIRDYFYKNMPEHLRQEFANKFDLDADSVKENIYKKVSKKLIGYEDNKFTNQLRSNLQHLNYFYSVF